MDSKPRSSLRGRGASRAAEKAQGGDIPDKRLSQGAIRATGQARQTMQVDLAGGGTARPSTVATPIARGIDEKTVKQRIADSGLRRMARDYPMSKGEVTTPVGPTSVYPVFEKNNWNKRYVSYAKTDGRYYPGSTAEPKKYKDIGKYITPRTAGAAFAMDGYQADDEKPKATLIKYTDSTVER